MNNSTGWVVAAVMVFAGVFAGYMVGTTSNKQSSSSVQEAGTSFISALTSGDVDATYDLSSDAYQSRNTKDYVRTISESLKSSNPEFTEEEVFFGADDKKDQAIYLTTVKNLPRTDLNSNEGSFVLRLVKEGDSWKVDSSQVY